MAVIRIIDGCEVLYTSMDKWFALYLYEINSLIVHRLPGFKVGEFVQVDGGRQASTLRIIKSIDKTSARSWKITFNNKGEEHA